jgi:uncharacterized membrane protein
MRADEGLQSELRRLDQEPPRSDDDALRQREARKSQRMGIIIGGIALLLAFFALPYAASLPAGLLLLDIAMAWGFINLVRIMSQWKSFTPDNAFLVALIPALAIPSLVRFLAAQNGFALPVGLRYTTAFPILLITALAFFLFEKSPAGTHDVRPWRLRTAAVAWLAGASAVAIFVALAFGATRVQSGAWETLGLTCAFVGAGLALQAKAYRLVPWRHARLLASGPALLLTATQLLDGTVSYLAVANPFGLLAQASTEQIALSAFLIEWTGPGYILAKWALAIILVRVLDGPGMRHRLADPLHRFMLYLVMAYIGMGPAIYSSVNLLV